MRTNKIAPMLVILLLVGCGKTVSAYDSGHKSCAGRFPVDMDRDGRFEMSDAQEQAKQNWAAQIRQPPHQASWVSGCADAVATSYSSLRKLDPTLPPMKP
jgi:hypothetical protein